MVLLKAAFGVVFVLFGPMCVGAGTFEVVARRVLPVAYLGESYSPATRPNDRTTGVPASGAKAAGSFSA
jgi:hypothetical protein